MDDLARRIVEVALLRGTFTLRSGRTSHYYLDKYLFETQPAILAAIGQRLKDHVDANIDRLAGPELGGIALVTAAVLASGKPAIFVRKSTKEYSTGKQIEGQLEKNDRILLIEDVVTTGGQLLDSARVIQDAGAEVVKIVAVVDRQEGGRENIEKAGFSFKSLFTKADLGVE